MVVLGAGNISGLGKLMPEKKVMKKPKTSGGKLTPAEGIRVGYQVGKNPRHAIRQSLQAADKPSRAVKRTEFMKQGRHIERFKGQSFLEQNAISLEVATDYQARMLTFKQFVSQKRLSISDESKLDLAFNRFLNELFFDGNDIGEATKFLAALIDSRPDCSHKGSLPRSRRSLQGWHRLDPGRTRPPIPWEVIAEVVLIMLNNQHQLPAFAVLLMFDAYLRPGEALQLRQLDLIRPTSVHPHHALNLHPSERMESSKMGLSDESLILDSPATPWMGQILQTIQKHVNSSQLMFPIDYRRLRDVWEASLMQLGLEKGFAVLYQIRHSGPSYDRLHKNRSLSGG